MENRVIPPDHASARQTEMGEKFNRVLFSALDALHAGAIPYALIGGIAASGMGRPRSTHDIDVFVRPEDADAALEALGQHGFETERTDRRWLYKGWKEEMMVDIIFKSSGDIYFDSEMQKHAKLIHYHGRDIPAVSPEDLIIIKAVVHSEIGPHHWHDALALLSHAQIDWDYLLKRARRAPRRILALLIYAQSNDIWIPNAVIVEFFKTVFGDSLNQQAGSSGTQSKAPTGQQAWAASGARAGSTANQPQSTTNPRTTPTIPDEYVIGKIQNALALDDRTGALDIDLAVGGRKVLVKGEVMGEHLRRDIEDVIHETVPDYEIDNQVRITDLTPPTAEEVV